MKIYNDDTIAAVSTPPGASGIGIVRISGKEAFSIIESLFKYNKKRELLSHTIHYGYIVSDGEIADEVLVMVMRGPRSYTTEDVVEINCHGGVQAVKKVLSAVLKKGARLAEPGEFTKRAFLNGRIDLSQAEAVIDIINAGTEISHKAALNQLEGKLSGKIKKCREMILEIIAHIEASIDYPESDIEDKTPAETGERIIPVKETLLSLYKTADTGKIIREGVRTVILGTPNVGKSSLLNYLVDEERAIVTDIPGTTRDALHEFINLNGVPVKIVDTAGVRDAYDEIERIGVERSMKYASEADLILFVLDGSREMSENDREILKFIHENQKKTIIIVNKIDLPQKIDLPFLEKYINKDFIIQLSVREDLGFDRFYEMIKGLFFNGGLDINQGQDMVVINERMKQHIYNAVNSLKAAEDAACDNMPVDLLAVDLMEAYESLSMCLGESLEEDVIDKIFTDFCLGK